MFCWYCDLLIQETSHNLFTCLPMIVNFIDTIIMQLTEKRVEAMIHQRSAKRCWKLLWAHIKCLLKSRTLNLLTTTNNWRPQFQSDIIRGKFCCSIGTEVQLIDVVNCLLKNNIFLYSISLKLQIERMRNVSLYFNYWDQCSPKNENSKCKCVRSK